MTAKNITHKPNTQDTSISNDLISSSNLPKSDLEYFKQGEIENTQFWFYLKGEPPLEGLTVLDIGCGHGSLCVDMASKGAKKVVGIGINERLIKFARQNVLLNYPQLQDKIDFRLCDIAELDEGDF